MGGGQFELASPPEDAISAVKFAPGHPTLLLVSSWDRHVYLYDIGEGDHGRLIRKFEHRAPVLDVCWGKNDTEAFTAGLDCDVKKIDLETGEETILSSHEAGVKSVVYSPENKILISGSWDYTLHIHFPDSPSHPPSTLPLPEKPFSLSLSDTKLVVAMSNRANHIYELEALTMLASQASQDPPNTLELEPWQRRESSMKFMTRAVACMPTDAGYASSSIEGRVAVEWFDAGEESQARKYAFKCHRQQVDSVDVVYPVNALVFHPVHKNTFASGGGDGTVALWDGVGKRRIKQYPKYAASIASLDFSADGKFLAVGISPGFEDGQEDMAVGKVQIQIKPLADDEAKAKASKKG